MRLATSGKVRSQQLVRHPGGECLAALRTGIVKNCLHAAYLEYQWNGQGIDAVFEVNRVM